MTGPAALPQLDERAIASGTTIRFVLLVGLLVVSSADMMFNFVTIISGATPVGSTGCALAAGADPAHSTDIATYSVGERQNAAYQACLARFQAPIPWWLTVMWPVLLVILAGALFWGLPRWKQRRRTVPLDVVDVDGAIAAALEKLRQRAGLDTLPTIVVDRSVLTATAVVFGSDRRPILCLHGGLLARRITSPSGFDAVLLHELGHVRNRDITVTYAAVTVWRVFVLSVLLPFLASDVWAVVVESHSMAWNTNAQGIVRDIATAMFLVVLVYLARSDVLRTREIYADRCALRWGASPRIWAMAARTGRPAWGIGRAWASFAELWRTHPRWELRRDALNSSAILFGVQGLPLFLAGAAADLAVVDLNNDLAAYHALGTAVEWTVLLVAAALVTAVAGLVLWRAQVHAMLLVRPAPSGVVAGLWLGAGLVTAELVSMHTVVYQWFPSRPELLLLMLCAGVAFAWWTTRCARLWITVWRGRRIWPVIVLVLVTGGFALAAWLGWWVDLGTLFADGEPLDPNTLLGPGAEPTSQQSILFVLMSEAGVQARQPLVLAAIAGLAAVPLLAWLVRSNPATPAWSYRILSTGADLVSFPPRPPLRRVFLAGVLGGVIGWLAQAGLMAYVHAEQSRAGPNYAYVVMFCVLVASVVAAMAGAVIGAHAGGQHRLVVALIAAQVAPVVSIAGQLLLIGSDGCVPPLATLRDTCVWQPWPVMPVFQALLAPALVVGFVLAFGVAAVVLGIRHAWQPAARPIVHPGGQRRGAVLVRRLCVGVLCAVVVGTAVTAQVILAGQDTPAVAASVAPGVPSNQSVSAQTKATQMAYWNLRGGSDLMGRFLATSKELSDTVALSPDGITGATLRPFCANYDQLARDAAAYLQVPDPQAELIWRTFLAQVRMSGTDCDHAAAGPGTAALNTTLGDIDQALSTANSFEDRLSALQRPGG